jgi:pilus assembly protein CpaC
VRRPVVTIGALLLAIGALGAGASATTPAPSALPQEIRLYVGDSRVLNVDTLRVAVGNGAIVSVTSLPKRQLLLLAESPGRTALQVWLRDGTRHRIDIDVSAEDIEATARVVRELLGGVEGISARVIGSRIVLEGLAAGGRARDRAAAIATLYPHVVVDFVGKVAWETMIRFDVRIIEMRTGALQDLGVRWRDEIAGPNVGLIAEAVSNPVRGGADAPREVWPPVAYAGWVTAIDSRIRLLEQQGDAAVVAEPMLSCRSGGSARFVSGGELPIPVFDALGGADVEYKDYGVILDVRPVAGPDGTIFARIDTEVSQVDNAQTVLGVPGFLKHQSATEVNLRAGETLVIAGLVNRVRSRDRQQVPVLGNLPAIGAAFRSRARRSQDSELAIFITPRFATPEPASDVVADDADALARSLQQRAEALPPIPAAGKP